MNRRATSSFLFLIVPAIALAAGCADLRPAPPLAAPAPKGAGVLPPPPPAAAAAARSARPGLPAEGFADLVARVAPAVVEIAVAKDAAPAGDGRVPMGPFGPYMPAPYGRPAPRAPIERGEGSGVIVTADGYILTNAHVVDGARDVHVRLSDRRELAARVVGADPKTDLAVIKVDATGLPAARLADSTSVRVGDYALAIGNPFGLGQTVTLGIVSAVGRGGMGIADYEDFIQTDAAINPGNSGGALIDTAGDVIGINTAILSHGVTPGNEGVAFAVPSSLARSIMEQIIAHGHVTRGWLGVAIRDVKPGEAESLGLGAGAGAYVNEVTPDSPAAAAGLKKGDVVLEVDGRPIADSRSLRLLVAATAPGTRAALSIWRGGKRVAATPALGELAEGPRRVGDRPGGGFGPFAGPDDGGSSFGYGPFGAPDDGAGGGDSAGRGDGARGDARTRQ
jgi:serine protease Do